MLPLASVFPGKLVLRTAMEEGTGESATDSSEVSPSSPDFSADPADDPVVDLLGDPSFSVTFQGGGDVAKKLWKGFCGDMCDAICTDKSMENLLDFRKRWSQYLVLFESFRVQPTILDHPPVVNNKLVCNLDLIVLSFF